MSQVGWAYSTGPSGTTFAGANFYGSGYGVEQEPTPNIEWRKIKELNVDEAQEIVQKVLKTNIVPFLWGPPGVGKSSLIKNICAENRWKLIDLRLSLLNPVDLRGLPVVDKDNHTADWLPPSFLPKYESQDVGILFLDEINLAPLSVQAAAYQLILDKRVGEYRFPPTWKIVAAGNRETDKSNVYKISAPLANRFIHFTITPDWKTWKKWATKNIRQEIIDFLALRPALLFDMPTDTQKAFPSPRTWDFTSTLMDIYNYNEEDGTSDDLQKVIVGTVGEGAGREFISFLDDYKLKEVGKMVEKFISTGLIKMPKPNSMRWAIIKAIYAAYLDGKITKETFEQGLVSKVSAEERGTIQDIESKRNNESYSNMQI